MKIKLTEEWHRRKDSFIHEAWCHNIHLMCYPIWPDDRYIKHACSASLKRHDGVILHQRIGPYRDRPDRAIQDTDKLVTDLVLDMQYYTKDLVNKVLDMERNK